jgi:hypothetical protein
MLLLKCISHVEKRIFVLSYVEIAIKYSSEQTMQGHYYSENEGKTKE